MNKRNLNDVVSYIDYYPPTHTHTNKYIYKKNIYSAIHSDVGILEVDILEEFASIPIIRVEEML